MPTSKVIDRKMVKRSGATNWTAIAPSAPAMPVYSAETPKVSDLMQRGVDAHRLGRDRLVADRDHRAADAAAQQVPAEHEQQHRPAPA